MINATRNEGYLSSVFTKSIIRFIGYSVASSYFGNRAHLLEKYKNEGFPPGQVNCYEDYLKILSVFEWSTQAACFMFAAAAASLFTKEICYRPGNFFSKENAVYLTTKMTFIFMFCFAIYGIENNFLVKQIPQTVNCGYIDANNFINYSDASSLPFINPLLYFYSINMIFFPFDHFNNIKNFAQSIITTEILAEGLVRTSHLLQSLKTRILP